MGGSDRFAELRAALRKVTTSLVAELNQAGHWRGELSSSALSTATAVTALTLLDRARSNGKNAEMIERGLEWLADHQNEDGGWGDTVRSKSNISTTALA